MQRSYDRASTSAHAGLWEKSIARCNRIPCPPPPVAQTSAGSVATAPVGKKWTLAQLPLFDNLSAIILLEGKSRGESKNAGGESCRLQTNEPRYLGGAGASPFAQWLC